MRLGGCIYVPGNDPEAFALAHVKKGFGAPLPQRKSSVKH
jgi:hypothetical protein